MAIGPVGTQSAYQRWTAQIAATANVNSSQGAGAAAKAAAAPDRAQTEAVTPHVLTPNDSLTQHLTDGDRANFMSADGVEIRPNGEILTPMSMGTNETQAVLATAGQVAADRANGADNSQLTVDYIRDLFRGFQERIANGLPPFQEQADETHVDLLA